MEKKNHYICSSQLRADQMPGPPQEGQLMWTPFLNTHQELESCISIALQKHALRRQLACSKVVSSLLGMLQMGGPEGVRAAEHLSITMSCDKGMKMHVIPRA